MIHGGDSKIRRWVMRGLPEHQRCQLREGIVRVDHETNTDSCVDGVKECHEVQRVEKGSRTRIPRTSSDV